MFLCFNTCHTHTLTSSHVFLQIYNLLKNTMASKFYFMFFERLASDQEFVKTIRANLHVNFWEF